MSARQHGRGLVELATRAQTIGSALIEDLAHKKCCERGHSIFRIIMLQCVTIQCLVYNLVTKVQARQGQRHTPEAHTQQDLS